ncbi:amidohydrolase family protein [Paraburkholderia sediminicola]|uniref:amidohydrolase family protein n=1 Tax=Paraburkholderia sediminicola TaxID=458836 RepID=UPI0038BA5828
MTAQDLSGSKTYLGTGRGIIDVHSHALLPVWLNAVSSLTGLPVDKVMIAGTPVPQWSVNSHLAMMDVNGIAACVLSWPGATSFLKGKPARDLARAMNEEFANIVSHHPTRFGAFAVVPTDDMEACVEEMAYALDVLKLDGVSTGTHVGGVYLGDPQFDTWFDEMNRRKTTLFIHPMPPPGAEHVGMTINPAILEFMFDSTRMATNMVLSGAKKRFGDVKMICTHGGGTIPYLASRISLLEPVFGAGPGRPRLTAREVLDGLSSFYFDLTASTAATPLAAMRRFVPSSQLMLGFDFPMMPVETVPTVWNMFDGDRELTEDDRHSIVQGTALDILPTLSRQIASGA